MILASPYTNPGTYGNVQMELKSTVLLAQEKYCVTLLVTGGGDSVKLLVAYSI